MTLQGKVALIAGGGRGIGAATAKLLAARGASVVVNYLKNSASAEQVITRIRANGGQAIAVQANVRDAHQAESLVQEALNAYGRIDILVNSTTPSGVFKPFEQISWDEFAQGINNELKAAFMLTKAVLPTMQQQHYGRIIYIASGLAKVPSMDGAISIGTAKNGLVAFTKYIAKEYGPSGITANIVSPGMVETELSAMVPAEYKQRVAAIAPLRRIAQPEDIARAIAFFASDDSGFMTGTYAPVNGGMAMD
ncbi:MAG: SDR family oxidoreductase [Chloroflexi bacterium]|nr:SDR family oxidoreductase [Chloroflexota bacterium]